MYIYICSGFIDSELKVSNLGTILGVDFSRPWTQSFCRYVPSPPETAKSWRAAVGLIGFRGNTRLTPLGGVPLKYHSES